MTEIDGKTVPSLHSSFGTDQMAVFIITGARRTGTTLLNQILCSDPTTNPQIGEARLLAKLFEAYGFGEESYDRIIQWYFPSHDHYDRFFHDIIRSFFTNLSSKYPGVENWVLKTPSFALALGETMALMPEAKFVVCVRHPLDQIASDFEVGQRQIQSGLKKTNAASKRNFRRYAQSYMNHYKAFETLPDHSAHRIYFLKYEDLLTETEGAIAELTKFTGLDLSAYNPDAPWQDFLNKDELATMPAHVEQYGQPLDRNRIGRYQGLLSEDEIELIRDICAPMIERFYG